MTPPETLSRLLKKRIYYIYFQILVAGIKKTACTFQSIRVTLISNHYRVLLTFWGKKMYEFDSACMNAVHDVAVYYNWVHAAGKRRKKSRKTWVLRKIYATSLFTHRVCFAQFNVINVLPRVKQCSQSIRVALTTYFCTVLCFVALISCSQTTSVLLK